MTSTSAIVYEVVPFAYERYMSSIGSAVRLVSFNSSYNCANCSDSRHDALAKLLREPSHVSRRSRSSRKGRRRATRMASSGVVVRVVTR